jgi:hypothetical protein
MANIIEKMVPLLNGLGSKEWYLNGEPHREDGPAVESAYGSKYWYVDGKEIEVPNNDNDIFLRMINLKAFW